MEFGSSGILEFRISGFMELRNEGMNLGISGFLEFSIFIFLGLGSNFDLVLASVHQFRVYESEGHVGGSLELGKEGLREITREVMG